MSSANNRAEQFLNSPLVAWVSCAFAGQCQWLDILSCVCLHVLKCVREREGERERERRRERMTVYVCEFVCHRQVEREIEETKYKVHFTIKKHRLLYISSLLFHYTLILQYIHLYSGTVHTSPAGDLCVCV